MLEGRPLEGRPLEGRPLEGGEVFLEFLDSFN
jgi:hypothetical protein